jgi:hypothetical protein
MRSLLLAAALAAIVPTVSCSPAKPAAEAVKEAEPTATPDPAAAEKQRQAEQKAAYEAVKSDEPTVDALADTGNGFALYHRGAARIASTEFTVQQGGFEDMEAAADAGNAEAQFWVGQRMAYGQDGYPWKPNSGLMMMEKAASQGNMDAILAVGLMYEQDGLMKNPEKAKQWYQRGADLGSEKAKDALAKLGTQEDF